MIQSRKKLLIISVVVFIILALLLFFRSSIPTLNMYQSSIVANNIQSLKIDGSSIHFFTGSNIAEMKLNSKITTQNVSQIIPMESYSETKWTSDGLLVHVNRLSEEGYLINLVPESDKELFISKPSWWLITNSGVQMFSIAGFSSTEISDILIYKDMYYIVYGDSSSQLYGIATYKKNTANESISKTNQLYSQPKLIGIIDNTLYFKDASGLLYTFNNGTVTTLDIFINSAQWDSDSGSIIVSQARQTESTQGENSHNHPEEYSISLLRKNTELTKLFKSKTGKYSVSNGRVLAPHSDKNSKEILSYTISDSTLRKIRIINSEIDVLSIVNLVPFKDLILAIDRENNLSVVSSSQTTVDTYPDAVLVKSEEKTTSTDWFLVDYDFTTNSADVVVYDINPVDAPQTIAQNFTELSDILGDPNQVKLRWSFAGPAD